MMKNGSAKRAWRGALCLLVALPFLLSGCGGNDESNPVEGPPPPRVPSTAAYDLAVSGWQHFTEGDYDQALSSFDQSLAVPDHSDYLWALEGRGWSLLRLDNLPAADAAFDSALAHFDNWQDTASEADSYVGKSFVASARGEYSEAASAGTQAAEVGGESYVFRGDSSIDVRHPRLVAAEAYVRLGEYMQAYNMLVALDVTILERVNPQSGQFVQLLVEELERISLGL